MVGLSCFNTFIALENSVPGSRFRGLQWPPCVTPLACFNRSIFQSFCLPFGCCKPCRSMQCWGVAVDHWSRRWSGLVTGDWSVFTMNMETWRYDEPVRVIVFPRILYSWFFHTSTEWTVLCDVFPIYNTPKGDVLQWPEAIFLTRRENHKPSTMEFSNR